MSSLHRSAEGEQAVRGLLESVRIHFYIGSDYAQFQRDRRTLLYALTWPAHWLDRRGLYCSPRRYRELVSDRLAAIRAHGDPARYGDYFPAYLLKCLQDFFDHNEDDLNREFKHIRNALESLQGSLTFAQRAGEQSRQIEAVAVAHRILRTERHSSSHADPDQITLF